ncbi:MAG: SH3 domain-containing protein [Oscillospiraceae bacterium]
MRPRPRARTAICACVSYPEPDAEILAQLPNGTPVTVLGNFDTWYTVRADTLYGFAPITDIQLAVMPLTEE